MACPRLESRTFYFTPKVFFATLSFETNKQCKLPMEKCLENIGGWYICKICSFSSLASCSSVLTVQFGFS